MGDDKLRAAQPLNADELTQIHAAFSERIERGESMHDVTLSGPLLMRLLASALAASATDEDLWTDLKAENDRLRKMYADALAASATDEPDDFGTVWHETRATVTSDGSTTHYVTARPAVPALDVELLAMILPGVIEGWFDQQNLEMYFEPDDWPPLAEAIAAKYAALSPKEPTDDR